LESEDSGLVLINGDEGFRDERESEDEWSMRGVLGTLHTPGELDV